MTDESNPIVTCTCCKTRFEGFAPTQANGCAADIDGDVVVGFYGSAVADMVRLRFVPGRQPEGLASGQICDACISRLKEDDALRVEEEDLSPFGDAAQGLDDADLEDLLEGMDEDGAPRG